VFDFIEVLGESPLGFDPVFQSIVSKMKRTT